MKLKSAIFLLAVLGILLATPAGAYRPGPDIIRECPTCKTPLAQQTMMSGNTFGARFWTAQARNLRALANILDEKNPDQRITKAEIYRESGDFDGCINLLRQPFDEAHHNAVAAFIRKLAEQKTRPVREIATDGKPN